MALELRLQEEGVLQELGRRVVAEGIGRLVWLVGTGQGGEEAEAAGWPSAVF